MSFFDSDPTDIRLRLKEANLFKDEGVTEAEVEREDTTLENGEGEPKPDTESEVADDRPIIKIPSTAITAPEALKVSPPRDAKDTTPEGGEIQPFCDGIASADRKSNPRSVLRTRGLLKDKPLLIGKKVSFTRALSRPPRPPRVGPGPASGDLSRPLSELTQPAEIEKSDTTIMMETNPKPASLSAGDEGADEEDRDMTKQAEVVPCPSEEDTTVQPAQTISNSNSSVIVPVSVSRKVPCQSEAASEAASVGGADTSVDLEALTRKVEETMEECKIRQRELMQNMAQLQRESLSKHKELCAQVTQQLSLDPLVNLNRLIQLQDDENIRLDVLKKAVSEAEEMLDFVEKDFIA